MFKLGLVVLLTVLAVQCVDSNAIQNRNAEIAVEHLIRLQRDLNSTTVDLSDDSSETSWLNSLLTSVISVVGTFIIKTACVYIQPFLTILSLFKSTVIVAATLIVEFAVTVVNTFIPNMNGSLSSISSGIHWMNETISNGLTFASNSNCPV